MDKGISANAVAILLGPPSDVTLSAHFGSASFTDLLRDLSNFLVKRQPVDCLRIERKPRSVSTELFQSWSPKEYGKFAEVKIRDAALSRLVQHENSRIMRLFKRNCTLDTDTLTDYQPIINVLIFKDIVVTLRDIGFNMGCYEEEIGEMVRRKEGDDKSLFKCTGRCQLTRFHFWGDSRQIRSMVESAVDWVKGVVEEWSMKRTTDWLYGGMDEDMDISDEDE